MALSNEDQGRAAREIIRRAATDPEFRKRAIADPHGVIKEVTGYDVPPDVNISFSEGALGATYSLPPLINDPTALSDDELEAKLAADKGDPPPTATGHQTGQPCQCLCVTICV